MIGLGTIAASLKGVPRGVWLALGAVLLVLLVYQCGRKAERSNAEAERAVANVEAMKVNEAANTNAADSRVVDNEQVLELKEELTNAVAQIPDDVPDPVAVALGCRRLRASGTDTSAIPACGRR